MLLSSFSNFNRVGLNSKFGGNPGNCLGNDITWQHSDSPKRGENPILPKKCPCSLLHRDWYNNPRPFSPSHPLPCPISSFFHQQPWPKPKLLLLPQPPPCPVLLTCHYCQCHRTMKSKFVAFTPYCHYPSLLLSSLSSHHCVVVMSSCCRHCHCYCHRRILYYS